MADGRAVPHGAGFGRIRRAHRAVVCDRLTGSARRRHDDRIFQTVMDRLGEPTRCKLDALVEDSGDGSPVFGLRADPGRVGLESLLEEIDKLERRRALGLPADVLDSCSAASIKRYRRRAATESPWEPRRHPQAIRAWITRDTRRARTPTSVVLSA